MWGRMHHNPHTAPHTPPRETRAPFPRIVAGLFLASSLYMLLEVSSRWSRSQEKAPSSAARCMRRIQSNVLIVSIDEHTHTSVVAGALKVVWYLLCRVHYAVRWASLRLRELPEMMPRPMT